MPELNAIPAEPRRERRCSERRSQSLHSLLIGGLGKNRRRGPRRSADTHGYYVDWYETRLLAVTLAIVLLCSTDALFTLALLDRGAEEVNIFMAHLIEQGVGVFVGVKMAVTAVGLLILVAHSSFRLLGLLRVKHVLYAILASYSVLFVYQIDMFSRI